MTLVVFTVLGSVDPAIHSELCLPPCKVSFIKRGAALFFGGQTGLHELFLIKLSELTEVLIIDLVRQECIVPFGDEVKVLIESLEADLVLVIATVVVVVPSVVAVVALLECQLLEDFEVVV